MDIRKIKTLIEMLEESNLNEIEVSQGDESVRISKGKDPVDYIKNNQINTSISSQEKVSINEDDTKKICEDLILKLGASSIKDMGKVMGELKKKHSDEIDFAKAGILLKQLLNK